MSNILLIGFFAALLWVVVTIGIEPALVIATLVSGLVWFIYHIAHRNEDAATPVPGHVEYARSFFPIFLIVLVLRAFLVEPFRIPSGSMMPTLLVGDFILVNKFAWGLRLPITKDKVVALGEPKRGDVAVFRWPPNPKLDYIKRVIGVPGDRIRYQNKTLYINGEQVGVKALGPYTPEGSGMRATGSYEATEQLGDVAHSVLINPMYPDFGPSCGFLGHREITVPAGHYFMMGDNRDDSNDGRCWGLVPEENLVGKAFMIWMSWDWQRTGIVAPSRIGTLVE